jgi:glucose/arabinose dehydrogenase
MPSDCQRSRFGESRVLILCALILKICWASAEAQSVPALDAVKVATLSQALFVTSPPGDFNRVFIVRQSGQINILKLDTGIMNAAAFLDLSTNPSFQGGGERGLLGMAFDPDYANNRTFYLYFTVTGGVWGQGTTHISQFQVPANTPDVASPTEMLLVRPQPAPSPPIPLTFDHPQSNHNAGWIGFSPRANDDHNLYIATGDGGNGNDQDPVPTPSPPGHIEPRGNAQNLTTLLGKILRVHVDPVTATYSIPSDNPFISTAGARPEIWAYGLRNPFRDSFDRLTGRMFIADVGQAAREEVDVQQPSNPGGGENYGWRLREGTIATPTGNPVVGGPPPPGNVEPILDYPRTTGGTVIGGYVYRGKQIPGLQGTYVFGDYVASKIFTLNYDGTTVSNFQDITAQLFPTSTGDSLVALSSFGEDANGELYITDVGSGKVFKIVPVTPNVQIDKVTKLVNGHMLVQGSGVPFKVHNIQASPDLVQPFVTIGTATAGGDGAFQFDDANAASFTKRFYRATYP